MSTVDLLKPGTILVAGADQNAVFTERTAILAITPVQATPFRDFNDECVLVKHVHCKGVGDVDIQGFGWLGKSVEHLP